VAIDVFIVSSFPAPRLPGTVPASTFSFACANVGGRLLALKMKNIQREWTSPAASLWQLTGRVSPQYQLALPQGQCAADKPYRTLRT
jgi:hypothetical protein